MSSDFLALSQPGHQTIRSCLAVAATGLGKAQPKSERVLTPTGWKPIGLIRPFDLVIGADGKPTEVVGVYPQGEKPVWKVRFEDGTESRCCKEHLWTVDSDDWPDGARTMTTEELQQQMQKLDAPLRTPQLKPVQFTNDIHTVDPYTVGVLLAGTFDGDKCRFSGVARAVIDKACVLSGMESKHEIDGSCVVSGVAVPLLRSMMMVPQAHPSRIPEHYQYGTVEVRMNMLKGLMDAAGYYSVLSDSPMFITESYVLAGEVMDLVRSLGGITSIEKIAETSHQDHVAKAYYRVAVTTPSCPFSVYSKTVQWSVPHTAKRGKAITAIVQPSDTAPREECVCIRVAADDSLYVTTGYNVTHNTVMMAAAANHWPNGRVMMLSHRFELNTQAVKTFEHLCGEEVALEQANYQADRLGPRCRIVVASVQTLNSKRKGRYRMERFAPEDFGLIMVDEAHRAAAASYRRVFQHFASNPDCKFLGVTATPDRLDKVGLGTVFDEVACDYNIRWGIENGWLVAPHQKFVRVDGLDMSSIRTVGGDLDERQLARLVEVEDNLHAMAKPIVDVAGQDKQTIVFTASVPQAHRLSELIRDNMARKFGSVDSQAAVSLDGSLSPQDPRRRQIVADFKAGRIQYLVNCGVATEGFDAPGVKLIAIGRPTKSRALYTQMLGRGTRPLPGTVDGLDTPEERIAAIAASEKPYCTILDFVGQSGRHSLVCTTDILRGEQEPDEIVERAKKVTSNPDFDGSTLDAIREAREQMAAEREAARAKLTVDVEYELVDADTSYTLASLPKINAPGYLKHKPATPKQKSMLRRLGWPENQIVRMNPRTASAAIDHAIKHPTTSFGRWLKQQKAKDAQKQESI